MDQNKRLTIWTGLVRAGWIGKIGTLTSRIKIKFWHFFMFLFHFISIRFSLIEKKFALAFCHSPEFNRWKFSSVKIRLSQSWSEIDRVGRSELVGVDIFVSWSKMAKVGQTWTELVKVTTIKIKVNLPSRLMPIAMHFLWRQYWHRFRLLLSIIQLPPFVQA